MHALASWLRSPLAAVAAISMAAWAMPAAAQFRDSIPSQSYYVGIEQLYRGNFRDAQRTFNRSLNGAVKTLNQGGTVRWIDSICYHAMLGETYYQWGQPDEALKQFDFACTLFLQYPRWMLRVQFDVAPTPDPALARVAAPWGGSTRPGTPGKFASTYPVAQGSLDNTRAVQQGGVIQQAQLWPVNIVEIIRCTTLAIRRRNELLGPLGPHDAISKQLAVALARGGAPPNHWSGAWVDVQRGLAHAGIGEIEQALQYLDRGTLVAGRFDHPLTGIALLEQGRLALASGNAAEATKFFAEGSYSAYMYGDLSVIDDAFRWGELARYGAGAAGINPALEPAAAWARRDRFDYLTSRLSLALAEELMTVGDLKNAAVALAAGAAQLGDARTGVLGNWATFLEARLEFEQQRASAPARLAAAIDGQLNVSVPNFQIALANTMYDAQTLPTRVAPSVYEVLLADPGPADSILRPLEVMAVMKTSHDDAFDRWLESMLDRKNLGGAIEVVDRAKRRRFHNAQALGGRLSALRDVLAAPTEALTPNERQRQSDLLTRFPELAETVTSTQKLRAELQSTWRPAADKEQLEKTTGLWSDYVAAINEREAELGRIGMARIPAPLAFPPLVPAAELQARLKPGQALLIFHDTPDGLLGFLTTAQAATTWNCGPSSRVAGLVAQFLRDLGNFDASREMSVEELQSEEWQKSGGKLYEALLGGGSISAGAIAELIVVPDGITWYVPFEALVAKIEDKAAPLVTVSKVRYAPTMGLAFSFNGSWRRVQRTGMVVGGIVPGEKPEERQAAVAGLEAALQGVAPLAAPLPAPSPAVASALDWLIVLEDVDAMTEDPLAWSPLPLDRSAATGALDQWLLFPGAGPQRVVLPGMHTLAERGGKGPRRRGAAAMPGDEFFFASCTLLSAGVETSLLSRWRVGGQSTLDLVREYVQELPHMDAAGAWQRSVQLAMEMPVDPVNELRVKAAPKDTVELTAKHPFFWAGYLVVDSGWSPEDDQPMVEGIEAEAAGVAAPAAAGAAQPAAANAPPPVPAAGAPAAAVPGEQPPAAEVGKKKPNPPRAPPQRPSRTPPAPQPGAKDDKPPTGKSS